MATPRLPDRGSSNDRDGNMQHLVQQNLLEALRPILHQIGDLQQKVSMLDQDAHAKESILRAQGSTLEQHEQQWKSFGVEFAQAKTRMGLAQTATDLLTQRVNQQAEDVAVLVAGLQQEENKVRDLSARMKEAQQDSEAKQEQIRQLQLGASKTDAVLEQLTSATSKLGEAVQSAKSDCAGISSRLNQHGETTGRSLQALVSNTSHQFEEVRQSIDTLAQRYHGAEGRVAASCDAVCVLEERVQEKLDKFGADLGKVVGDMNTLTGEQETYMKGMVENMNVSQAIVVAFQRLDKVEAGAEALLKEAHDTRQDLGRRVGANQKEVLTLADEVAKLEKAQKEADAQLQRDDRRIDQNMQLHSQAKERIGAVEVNLKGMTETQNNMQSKLSAHAQDISKAQQRLQENERRLDEADSKIDSVGKELSQTSSGVSKAAVRLDLAHEHLHGMGKGIQEAGKRILEGKEWKDVVRPTPRMLPSLPASSESKRAPIDAWLP
mmetsp:Transcript_67383/g.188022  ORF Transcript_67383/g.188022 Transcript_67383/m.188022 type:complete len:493 (-) Transcript_67383:63-1541(-)